jgi:hypothetical protein
MSKKVIFIRTWACFDFSSFLCWNCFKSSNFEEFLRMIHQQDFLQCALWEDFECSRKCFKNLPIVKSCFGFVPNFNRFNYFEFKLLSLYFQNGLILEAIDYCWKNLYFIWIFHLLIIPFPLLFIKLYFFHLFYILTFKFQSKANFWLISYFV